MAYLVGSTTLTVLDTGCDVEDRFVDQVFAGFSRRFLLDHHVEEGAEQEESSSAAGGFALTPDDVVSVGLVPSAATTTATVQIRLLGRDDPTWADSYLTAINASLAAATLLLGLPVL